MKFKYISIISFLNISILFSGYSSNSESILKSGEPSRSLPGRVKHIEGFDSPGQESSDTDGKESRTPSRARSGTQKITSKLLELRKNRRDKARVQSSVESDSDYEGSDSDGVLSPRLLKALKIGGVKAGPAKLTLKPSDLMPEMEEEEWL